MMMMMISKHCRYLQNTHLSYNYYEIYEHISKNLIKNILPADPTQKIRFIIYYNKFKTANLIISNNTSPSTELLDRTNIVWMFKCPLEYWVSKENIAYVGHTISTLSKRLTMHLNDASSIATHLKAHSITKSKFRKFLLKIPL